MIERRLGALRMTILAALGVSVTWGCGDDDSGGSAHGGASHSGGASMGGASSSGGTLAAGGMSGGTSARGGTSNGGHQNGGTSSGGGPGGHDNGGHDNGGHDNGGGGTIGGGGTGGELICVNSALRDPGSYLCTNGWTHRVRASVCQVRRSTSSSGGAGGSGGEAGASPFKDECTSSAQCTRHPFGMCSSGGPTTVCVYGCGTDSDCPSGDICYCADIGGEVAGTCLKASCATDADCGKGMCAAELWTDPCTGLPLGSFECHTTLPTLEGVGGAACGRPFLVNGIARTATLCATDGDYATATDIESRATRQALAQHWAQMALMEHASVAAFARFMLELLALGAPLHLLESAQHALSDEIEHARLCFDLASRYAGPRLSPGPLSLANVLTKEPSFADVVCCAFQEACIGESLAVAEAEAALAEARDPAVVAALTRIAADEAKHASLGFRFVAWALSTLAQEERAPLIDELVRVLRSALDENEPPLERKGSPTLRAHGVLSNAERYDARRRALSFLVLPCASALGISVLPGQTNDFPRNPSKVEHKLEFSL